jgi:hypothetical protein
VHFVYGDTDELSIDYLNALGYRTRFNISYCVSTDAPTTGLGSHYSQYGDNYVPYTVIIGRDRKVYFTMSGYDDVAARAAIDQAIADYDGLVYLANPVENKMYQIGSSNNIDVSAVFDQWEIDPVSVSIISNSNPTVASTTMTKANTINIVANATGTATLVIQGTDTDNNTATTQFDITVYDPSPAYTTIENFNDGNFTGTFTWTLANSGAGGKNWTVATTSPYEGTYCAQSGLTKDGGFGSIQVSYTYPIDGVLSFFVKTSTEAGYDYLFLYIDGVEKGKWSGANAWKRAYVPVTAGAHTFKWSYIKDANTIEGTDQVWLDYIEFAGVIQTPPSLSAPANITTSISGSNVVLAWDSVPGATGYVVYSSTDPYGTFAVDNSGSFNGTEWTVVTSATKKFYYVIATNSKDESPKSKTVSAVEGIKIKGTSKVE